MGRAGGLTHHKPAPPPELPVLPQGRSHACGSRTVEEEAAWTCGKCVEFRARLAWVRCRAPALTSGTSGAVPSLRLACPRAVSRGGLAEPVGVGASAGGDTVAGMTPPFLTAPRAAVHPEEVWEPGSGPGRRPPRATEAQPGLGRSGSVGPVETALPSTPQCHPLGTPGPCASVTRPEPLAVGALRSRRSLRSDRELLARRPVCRRGARRSASRLGPGPAPSLRGFRGDAPA